MVDLRFKSLRFRMKNTLQTFFKMKLNNHKF